MSYISIKPLKIDHVKVICIPADLTCEKNSFLATTLFKATIKLDKEFKKQVKLLSQGGSVVKCGPINRDVKIRFLVRAHVWVVGSSAVGGMQKAADQ